MSGLCAVPRGLAGAPPPPETPDVMDLECKQGGRKERIWGGGRLSSLSQAKSPKDKPRCILEMSTRQKQRRQIPITPKIQPATGNKPRTKATLPRYRDNSTRCKLLRIAFLNSSHLQLNRLAGGAFRLCLGFPHQRQLHQGTTDGLPFRPRVPGVGGTLGVPSHGEGEEQ